jgi:hypothetical protein
MGIGLMTHIPNDLVMIKIERLIQCQSQFDDSQTWPQMPTASSDGFQVLLSDLARHLFELMD